MTDYTLTEHARDALEKRQIQVAWLERALDSPEKVEPDSMDADLEHRLVRVAEHCERVLRNVKKIPPHVVTVFFDRRRVLP